MERTDFEQWKAKEVARLLALVETERRYYQEMVASLPVGIAVLSSDRFVVSANRAFRQIFGLRSEELRRKTIDQILGAERLVERIREVHVSGVAHPAFFHEFEARMLRIAIAPMRNWDDETEIETLLMVEDVSALETLRQTAPASTGPAPKEEPPPEPVSPPPVEQTIAVPAVLWKADPQTLGFSEVHGDAESLLGFPVSHWLETSGFFAERMHPDDRAATLALYQAAIARGGDASAEFRGMSPSGEVVWCRETIRHTGEPDAPLTGVITNVTRRRQLEEQWLAAGRVDALHGIASRLAHDLNNPLMIITGYGEEIRDALLESDPVRSDVEQILNAAGRISGLAGQLLNFTRHQASPPNPLNLTQSVSGLEEKLAQAAGSIVTLEIAPTQGDVWGVAEPAQLEEILLAIVSAARYGAMGRSRMRISCGWELVTDLVPAATLKPGVHASIAIQDDGTGLDPAKRATIFESFLAARDADSAAQSALARAYAIVREWGGDIACASVPLRGTTFTVFLPPSAVPETAVAPVEPAPVEQPVVEAPPVAPPPRKMILIVEDEAGIRALVRKILKREGFDVLEAGSAEEAMNVSAAHEGRIDLLLTDVILPGLKGRDLAEGMREALPGLKVLYISGYTNDEAVRTGEFPPSSRFLQKPFTLGALLNSVRESLEPET